MVERIKRLWRIFAYFIFAKEKTWGWPRQSKVLIFDAAGEDVLREYLQPWSPEVLHVRGEKICMPVLFASLFKKGRKTDAYIDAFIERVRPQLIVTFIDNNPGFYLLAQRHKEIKTLSIQNGIKSYYFDIFEAWDQQEVTLGNGEVTYLMTFGKRIGDEYLRYISGKIIPIGSLKNNTFPVECSKSLNTIAFISQFRETKGFLLAGRFVDHKEYFERADKIVLEFLSQYAEKKGKSLVIVPWSSQCEGEEIRNKERDYYCELLGYPVTFSDWYGAGVSYDSIDSSEVVVSIESALGYESAARGNKTAIFSIRSQLVGIPGLTFGWPEPYPDVGPFWTNRADTQVFEEILDHLFRISQDQWREELMSLKYENVMMRDPGNSILKTLLNKELNPAVVNKARV